MSSYETVTLSREVDAVRIPSGEKAFLPAGTSVTITQVLGGSYTVQFDGGLARIEAKDADALGKQVAAPSPPASTPAGAPAAPRTREQIDKEVQAALKTCYDPEIPVNIADLGLIYNCELTELAPESYKVDVKMTLTAPGCGMGDALGNEVAEKVLALDGVGEVTVDLVFDPPWDRSRMSDAALLSLGL